MPEVAHIVRSCVALRPLDRFLAEHWMVQPDSPAHMLVAVAVMAGSMALAVVLAGNMAAVADSMTGLADSSCSNHSRINHCYAHQTRNPALRG